jgi:hypothetical protein
MMDLLLFREPPPRPIPVNLVRNAGRHYRVIQKYTGIALICFGCFYAAVFAVLNAPREILAGAGGIGVLGMVLTALRARGIQRLIKLLRMGT